MRGHIEGQLGTITIESEVIARYAGSTAVECFVFRHGDCQHGFWPCKKALRRQPYKRNSRRD